MGRNRKAVVNLRFRCSTNKKAIKSFPPPRSLPGGSTKPKGEELLPSEIAVSEEFGYDNTGHPKTHLTSNLASWKDCLAV